MATAFGLACRAARGKNIWADSAHAGKSGGGEIVSCAEEQEKERGECGPVGEEVERIGLGT